MPIDEQKLRAILAEQKANIKRHVGVLVEETDRKFGVVLEGYQGLSDKIDGLSDKLMWSSQASARRLKKSVCTCFARSTLIGSKR
jgi:hypothetical protein